MFIDNPVQKYIYICDFKETKPGKLPFESPWLRISSFGADMSQKLFECHVCWVKIDLDRNTIYLVPFSRKPIPDLIDWLILISYLLVSVKKESPYPYPSPPRQYHPSKSSLHSNILYVSPKKSLQRSWVFATKVSFQNHPFGWLRFENYYYY